MSERETPGYEALREAQTVVAGERGGGAVYQKWEGCTISSHHNDAKGLERDVAKIRLFVEHPSDIMSQKVFMQSFCKSQFPYKSVILFFILGMIKVEMTNLCGK